MENTSLPLGPEDVRSILEMAYRQLWGLCVYLGQMLGKQPKACPHCGKALKGE